MATSAALACVTPLAQQNPPAVAAGLPERFRQLDRNRDGTVTRCHAPMRRGMHLLMAIAILVPASPAIVLVAWAGMFLHPRR